VLRYIYQQWWGRNLNDGYTDRVMSSLPTIIFLWGVGGLS